MAVYSSEAQPANSPDAVYDMVKVTTPATNYVAGVKYQTKQPVGLAPGRHWMRVQANDGSVWASGGRPRATGSDRR